MNYHEHLKLQKLGLAPKTTGPKEKKPMRKVSLKRQAENDAAKEARGEQDSDKERWFKKRRGEMCGTCQCGCGEPSSKKDDVNFRSSICHILPQRIFESVQFHHLNWVERKHWATGKSSACHTNMDNKSMDLWPNFADWDSIKEIFKTLDPLLTVEEKKAKFYTHLKYLIENN